MTVLLALAGGLGALTRYGLTLLIPRWITSRFPWAIAVINIAGSFIIGLCTAQVAYLWNWYPVVATGWCGGFTTMSTFAINTAQLWPTQKRYAIANVLLNVIGCWVAAYVGFHCLG